jgi:hypothetical protein
MKRKIVVFTIFAAFCTMNLTAQNANRQRLDAYKIAFFTKRLNLTSQEAEKFWPVYNEYQDAKNKIQLERQEINRNFNQNELNMNDRELTDAGDRFIGLQVREAALAQEFHNKIKTVLSPVKVMRLFQAENQYRIQLLNELRQRNQVRNNQNLRQQ